MILFVSSHQPRDATWYLIHNRDQLPIWVKLLPDESRKHERISVVDNVFYLHAMTTKLDRAVVECSIRKENSTSEPKNVKARIMLVAQDCGGYGSERTDMSMNRMNPCRHGSCRVTNDYGFELLECRCLPQFTGLYCDKLATYATYFELLYYSPVIALVAVLMFVACCFRHVEGVEREQPMAFEKHIPPGDLSVDMQKNFPAMFITPEQYAELAAAAHMEEVDAVAPDSKEWEPSEKKIGSKKSSQRRRDKSRKSKEAVIAPTQPVTILEAETQKTQ
ncbi:hypothetical protein Y032_0265g668 [Ancylostoma ceylanicum]|uniref:EGF-like domain-containing protein n=1 Tax=Ancylostoma ceylanicum TaxID=53326 RepID=A0A016S9K8_9BILA|nr:hypothetical protein Y032_0265g668 [Ancylostoma ceylanicum]